VNQKALGRQKCWCISWEYHGISQEGKSKQTCQSVNRHHINVIIQNHNQFSLHGISAETKLACLVTVVMEEGNVCVRVCVHIHAFTP
jgi:hypothetical protein